MSKRLGEIIGYKHKTFRGIETGSPMVVTLGLFESLSETVTYTRELISIHMCYSQGDGINTSLSRLPYLVLYTVVQLSTCRCTLSLYGTKCPMYWTLMTNVI